MSLFNKNKVDYEKLYKNELFKTDDLKNECIELKEKINKLNFENLELRSEINRYKFYCNELENKLKKNYSIIPKKVTSEVRDQVKNIVESGMTYRDITKQIDISLKTISRIMNGYYDKK